ncbi:MAG: hypothetical protein RIS64_1872 [Bacteroidota bacterium]|jgi:ABC-type methionine transport system permease subunit
MDKPLKNVVIINLLMICTASIPVFAMSEEGMDHFRLAVILGSMAAMNLVGGGGLGIFAVPEGKYMKRLGLLFFVLSILIFLVPTQF